MKKYRWNKKKFAKNVGKFAAVVAITGVFDFAVFVAFFGEAMGWI